MYFGKDDLTDWDARDEDLEGRIKALPFILINNDPHVSIHNVMVIVWQIARARRAYRVEQMEKHATPIKPIEPIEPTDS